MSNPLIPEITLNNGTTLPAIGFGTYKLNGAAGVAAMTGAIESGYRLLDSAFNYENEGAVGEAVRESVRAGTVTRDALRITSKLPGRHHAYDKALLAIEESLYRAQLSSYDLYLIHWPNPKQGLFVEAWRAMIEAQRKGWIRTIGVCNFLPEHLDALITETGVTPAVNQVELHPYFSQTTQLAEDRARGVVTQSWSPLGRAGEVMRDPVIAGIAQRLGKSATQVILRWHHQLGAIPLPKAASAARQIENLSVFDFTLSEEDMAAIAALSREDGRIANQDPAFHEEF